MVWLAWNRETLGNLVLTGEKIRKGEEFLVKLYAKLNCCCGYLAVLFERITDWACSQAVIGQRCCIALRRMYANHLIPVALSQIE